MTTKTTNALKAFRDAYVRANNEIMAIRNNDDLTPEARERRVNELSGRYQAEISQRKAAALNSLSDLQSAMKAKRKDDIVNGLKSADEITLITEGIKNGAFDSEMLAEIRDIYGSNPVGLDAIRGALNNAADEETRLLAATIPVDNTGRIIDGLSKAIGNIENVPAVDTPERLDDMGGAMWKSGASFDSLISYIDGIEE